MNAYEIWHTLGLKCKKKKIRAYTVFKIHKNITNVTHTKLNMQTIYIIHI